MMLNIVRSCAAAASQMKAAVSARMCLPDLYVLGVSLHAPPPRGMHATWNKGNLKEEGSTVSIKKGMRATWNKGNLKEEGSTVSIKKVMTNSRADLMYPRAGLISTINIPIMKRQVLMYPREALGYRNFSTFNNPMKKKVLTGLRTPLSRETLGYRNVSTFNNPRMKKQVQLFKEAVEKLLLYAKTVSRPVLEEVGCLVLKAVRTVWLVVTGLVWEYLWLVQKGFEDLVSQYHFYTFVAVILSFIIYLIEKFNLRSHFEFLFNDTIEDPIEALAKEVYDIQGKLKDQAELSDQDREIFISRLTEVINEVHKVISEIQGLKVRAGKLESCVEELQKELAKLKEK